MQAAVEKSGLPGDTSGVEKLRSQLYEPIIQELREILGEDGYRAYNEYQRTSYYRVVVDPLAARLVASNAPLSVEQREKLARLAATNDHPQKLKPTDIGSQTRIDWETVAFQARDMLSPEQMTVLQAFATQQKTAR